MRLVAQAFPVLAWPEVGLLELIVGGKGEGGSVEGGRGDGGGKEVIGEGEVVAGFEGWDPATGEVADK